MEKQIKDEQTDKMFTDYICGKQFISRIDKEHFKT